MNSNEQQSVNPIKGQGIPIYLDEKKRNLASSVFQEATDWHPGNHYTMLLYRCFEALKDIDISLQGSIILIDEEKRRRLAKNLITPLYSLCKAIEDILNYLNSSKEINKNLSKKDIREMNKLLNDFLKNVPTDKNSVIKGVRDQLSAHIDKLMPNEAKNIFDKAQTNEIGVWLHQCIVTLSKILSFEVFAWTINDCPQGYFKLMSVEPSLVTYKLDENNKPIQIIGLEITKSPKNLIVEVYEKIIQNSQWMFHPGDIRIPPA